MIEAAVLDDLPEILALERAVPEAPHWAEVEYASILNEDSTAVLKRCLLVAREGERLAGFAVGKWLSVEGEAAELESVAVDPAWRRRGLGAALCRAVMDWAWQQGASAMELEVRAASAGAITLYAGLGFVATGHRPGYYHAPEDDALMMRLERTGNEA